MLNEIGRVTVRTMEPVFVDRYTTSRDTGSFVLIDTATRQTVAAGMVRMSSGARRPQQLDYLTTSR